MPVRIRYMGSKRRLAGLVADVIRGLPTGPCLDLFSGMCSIGESLSDGQREVWCNDVQRYAAVTAEAFLKSRSSPAVKRSGVIVEAFDRNLGSLAERYGRQLEIEAAALRDRNSFLYRKAKEDWEETTPRAQISAELAGLRSAASTFPYRMVTLSFSWGYFGLRQAIELDSLRYAMDEALRAGEVTKEDWGWCLVATLQVASQVSASTGHFAQYLSVRDDRTFRRVQKVRSRSVKDRFFRVLSELQPFGSEAWRQGSRVFCSDALQLLRSLASRPSSDRPSVVYADPPYSKDQYSRYYHVLETLVLYDYPEIEGRGRYRPGRFQTPFSQRTLVQEAFAELVEDVSRMGACLVLSYPSNGLFFKVGGALDKLLDSHFKLQSRLEIHCSHSTMGLAKGKEEATELIIVASQPRCST
jgi:adenine-specific DNA-methyltransferase